MAQLTRLLTLTIALLLGVTALGAWGSAPASADESDLRGTDWRLVRVETARGCSGKARQIERAVVRTLRGTVAYRAGETGLRVTNQTPHGMRALVYRAR